MKDFLRAEWKTLVVAIVGLTVVYMAFARQEAVQTHSKTVEPNVIPGERFGSVSLGDSEASVRAAIGEPKARDSESEGVEVWHYSDQNMSVYFSASRVSAVRQDFKEKPEPDGVRATLPSGEELTQGLSKAHQALGEPRARLAVDGEVWIQHDGLVTIVSDVRARRPKAIIVVPSTL